MTSNNLEVIELLENCVGRLQEQGFLNYGNTLNELNKAIALLQADRAESSSEDIEVKEQPILGCSRCDWTSESAHPHSSHTPQPDHDWCKECTHSYKKPTKETKLVINNVRYELVSLGSVDVGKKHYPEVFALKKEEY